MNDLDIIPTELPVARPEKPDLAIVPAKTSTEMRVVEVSDALAPAYAKASTLELTDAEVAAIMAPFPDSTVDIRPHDGLIFLSHIHISDRLNAVFKPGKWALVCRRHWLDGATMYGEYVLLIRGCFIGESVGGHQYVASNPKVNYSDVLESTAAEALRRICGKRLSCGSQVWHKDYAEKWVSTYAEQVNGKWRKRAIAAPAPAPKPAPTPQPRPAPTPKPIAPATPDERKAKLLAILEPYRPEALRVLVEEGILMEGEDFGDISTTFIERTSPDQMLALIKTVKMRRADNDNMPYDEPPKVETQVEHDRSWEDAVLPFTSPKNPDAVKGMTLKELFANPKTSKYAFGLAMNFAAEPKTGANGKVYQPSQADVDFAEGCALWREQHPQDKRD